MTGLLRLSTAGSVDDGKSTLIGRLLYDSKGAYEDQLASIAKEMASVLFRMAYSSIIRESEDLGAGHAVAAINGDFFDITESQHPQVPATDAPSGPAVADGAPLNAAVPPAQRCFSYYHSSPTFLIETSMHPGHTL